MSDIIEEKDPRGVKIYCTQKQWENHIVADTGHPVMKENLLAVQETLRSPEYIYESHDSEPPLGYREVYSKKVPSASYYSTAPYTKAIVNVIGGSGELITAYPAKNPTGGTKGEPIYENHEN